MPRALERIANQLDTIDIDTLNGDENDRLNLLSAARALCQRLETPEEFVQRITCQEPTLVAALKIADDIQFFKHLSSLPQSIQTLALRTDTNLQLLKRVVRHLAAHNIVSEVLTPNSPIENGISSRRASLRIESRKTSRSNSIRIESRKTSRSNSLIGAIGTSLSNISSNIISGKNSDNSHTFDDARAPSPSVSPVTSIDSHPPLASLDAEVHYVSTAIGNSLATPQASTSIRALTDIRIPLLRDLPKFLAQSQYDDVRDARSGPFQGDVGQGSTYHEWLQIPKNLPFAQDDADLITTWKKERSWIDIFNPAHLLSETVGSPTEGSVNGHNTITSSKTQTSADASPTLLVDISAGQSISTSLFRQYFHPASFPGNVELVAPKPAIKPLVGDLTLGAYRITLVAHDILNSALKSHSTASRLYLLDSVLQYHPDADAKKILNNVSSGMRRGWSRLLICDHIMPERGHGGSSSDATGWDLYLMALCAGRVRTEAEWRDLIEREYTAQDYSTKVKGADVVVDDKDAEQQREQKHCGKLRVVAIHHHHAAVLSDRSARAVIECELA